MSKVEIRHLTQDEVAGAEQAFAILFGEPQDAERNAAETAPLAAERCVGAFDDGRIVGHVGIFPLDMSVPGAQVYAGEVTDLCAITLVFVDTTHRRKGLGKRMMMKALEEAHEPVAALWASRPGFYEKLGFEPAIPSALCTITTDDFVPLRKHAPEPERVERVLDTTIAARDMPIIYDQARAYRPGMTSRDASWWQHRFIGDAKWRRYGGGELQHVIAYRGDKPVAYAIYNLTPKHDQYGPNHEMTLHECVGVNATEEAALMGWLCQVDLVGKISAYWRPTDDGFVQSLVQRRANHEQITEALYVRILDVCKAIAGRKYYATGDFIVRLEDDLLPNTGTWRFSLSPEGGTAKRLDETIEADISLDIRALAGIWLGGYPLNAFVGAGLAIIHNPASFIPFHQAFHSPVAPWCPEVW